MLQNRNYQNVSEHQVQNKLLRQETEDQQKFLVRNQNNMEAPYSSSQLDKNQTETSCVKHSHGESIYNQTLSLEINMPYNLNTNQFEEKKCDFLAVIVFQGKIKSGGVAKLNLSDNLNSNPNGISHVIVPLQQSPDPSANIQISLSYQRLTDKIENDVQSTTSASSVTQELQMSKIDFQEDKISQQLKRIIDITYKMENLTKKEEKRLRNQKNGSGEKQMIEKIKKLQQILIEKEIQEKKIVQQKQQFLKEIENKNKQIKKLKQNGNTGPQKQNNQLYKENEALKTKVSSMSFRLAGIFNASYEYGGASLLDYIQNQIGLTQSDE